MTTTREVLCAHAHKLQEPLPTTSAGRSSSAVRRAPEPFSRADERFYTLLAANAGSRLAPRQIWRVQRAHPHLETGRMREIQNRVWIVPSTRREGKLYRVDLKTGECFSLPGGEVCPDKTYNGKVRCCHALAATLAEQQWLAEGV